DQNDRTLVDRVAALLADLRRPVGGEKILQRGDLALELARGAPGQGELVPQQTARGGERVRPEPGRLRVIHVGHHEHRGRMLVEAIGHLLEREPYVLEAYLLADDVER